MRRSSLLYEVLRSDQADVLDNLVESSLEGRQRSVRGRVPPVGSVRVWRCARGEGATLGASIVTEVAAGLVYFEPDSPAARLLHEAGVTHIPLRGIVDRVIPLDIATRLMAFAEAGK